eukprot:TRINITY_DN10504_c0_g1_i1.p1 TRINITY_DN10504_c0_g1~~TRINITY_DN10504_c0_g1_i1.p1  ORF type:complete len:174 (+),score=33.80 TRINITY_DN10504_c0_g1_i1:70-522(+)
MAGSSLSSALAFGLVVCLGVAAAAAPPTRRRRKWLPEMRAKVMVRISGPTASAFWIESYFSYFGDILAVELQVSSGVQVAIVTFSNIEDAAAAAEEEVQYFDRREMLVTWEGTHIDSTQGCEISEWSGAKRKTCLSSKWVLRPLLKSEKN